MPLIVQPDIEKLCIDHLLTVAEVTGIVEKEVGTKSDGPFPRVVISRVGGAPRGLPAWIDSARIQADCWDALAKDGGSRKAAGDLARVVQAALLAMPETEHELGIVTDVVPVLGPIWQPDPVTKRPRYLVDVIVRVHPHPSS